MADGAVPSTPVERMRAELQGMLDRAQAQVTRTLRLWGVSPHEPEGQFTEALQTAQRGMAEIVLWAGSAIGQASEGLDRHSAALTARADAEVARMRQASVALEAVHKKAEERTFEQLVGRLSDGVQKKLDAALVVRQHRWERVLYWRASGVIALAGLVLVIGGYQWKAYVDTDALQHAHWCADHVAADPQRVVWCRWPETAATEAAQAAAQQRSSEAKESSIW